MRATQKLTLMGLTALGLGAGLLVDVTLAHLVGPSSIADHIVIVLTVPFIADTILREGARYSLISIVHDSSEHASRVNGEYTSLALLACLCTFLVSQGAFMLISAGVGIGFKVTLLASITAAIFALSAVLLAISDALGMFFLSSCRNMIVHVSAIITFYALMRAHHDPLSAIVFGYGVGALVCCLTVLTTLSRAKSIARPARLRRETLKLLGQRFIPAVINVGGGQSMRGLERGALLQSASGSVFLFYIAFRIFASLQSLIGGTLATVSMRRNRNAARTRRGFRKVLINSAWQTAAYVAPCTIIILIFSAPIMRLVYGSKLSIEELQIVSQSVKIFGCALFFQALNVVIGTLWFSQARVFLMNVVTLVVVACASPLFFIAASNMGVIGVTCVTCAVTLVMLLANIVAIDRQLKKAEVNGVNPAECAGQVDLSPT